MRKKKGGDCTHSLIEREGGRTSKKMGALFPRVGANNSGGKKSAIAGGKEKVSS